LAERDQFRDETKLLQSLKAKEDTAHGLIKKQMIEKVKR
jgi:hypothetical protein